MSAGKSRGVRRLAPLAWLALVASLLATVPGTAQAQDNTAADPLTDAPSVVSAGPSDFDPHRVVVVNWTLSFSEDPDNPVNRNDIYVYDVEIAPDQNGNPGEWFNFIDVSAALISYIDKEHDANSGATTVTLRARLLNRHKLPTDKLHYRARIDGPGGSGPWAAVGPVSAEPLPATPEPTGFSAAPSSDDPQTRVVLSWDPVPVAGGDSVSYRIGGFNQVAQAWQQTDGIEATTYEQVFTVPNEFTAFRLWAVRDYGDLGTVVGEAAGTDVTPGWPPAPTGATAGTNPSDPSRAVVISWSAVPAEAGSSLFYQLRFRDVSVPGGSAEWSDPGPLWTSSTSYDHGGRAAATAYEYQVRAARESRSTVRMSEWSTTATVTTDADIGGL